MIYLLNNGQIGFYTTQIEGQALRDMYNLLFMSRKTLLVANLPNEAGGQILREEAFEERMRFKVTMDFHANDPAPGINNAIAKFTDYFETLGCVVHQTLEPLLISINDLPMDFIMEVINDVEFQMLSKKYQVGFSWRVTLDL